MAAAMQIYAIECMYIEIDIPIKAVIKSIGALVLNTNMGTVILFGYPHSSWQDKPSRSIYLWWPHSDKV